MTPQGIRGIERRRSMKFVYFTDGEQTFIGLDAYGPDLSAELSPSNDG